MRTHSSWCSARRGRLRRARPVSRLGMHDGCRHPMLTERRCCRFTVPCAGVVIATAGIDAWPAPRGRERREMSNFGRNLALWVIIALLLVVLFNLFQPGATPHRRHAGRLFRLHHRGERRAGARRGDPGPHRLRPAHRRPHLPDLHAGRSVAGAAPDRQGRAGDRQARGQRRQSAAALPAVAGSRCCC